MPVKLNGRMLQKRDSDGLGRHTRQRPRRSALALVLALTTGVTVLSFTASAAATPTQHKRHSGVSTQPVLDSFNFQCNYSNPQGLMSMQGGLIKACLLLIDAGAGFYAPKYDRHGFPVRVRLFLPPGSKILKKQGKIKFAGWVRGMPKIPKSDRHYTVKRKPSGKVVVQWFVHHLTETLFAGWYFTIRVPGSPSTACLKAVAVSPHVSGPTGNAPKLVSNGTFYDSSTGAPPPAKLCGT